MKIFITGATGVLGHRLVRHLSDRGHSVFGLVRDEPGAHLVADNGGIPRTGDVLDPASLGRALEDEFEVLVHAATAIPAATNPRSEDWAVNDRVRLDGIQKLLRRAPADLTHVLFPSVVWVARQPDGAAFDESADRHPDRATRSAAAVEDIMTDLGATTEIHTTVLRCGLFYAPDARDTRTWAERLLHGSLPIVGGGLLGRRDAALSFVHADDAAEAFVAAIEKRVSGQYHIVDDEPVSMVEFLRTFAQLLGARTPRRVPGWLARFVIGSVAVDLLTSPMPTTNDRASQDLDWRPQFPTCREGLAHIVETWHESGMLQTLAENS